MAVIVPDDLETGLRFTVRRLCHTRCYHTPDGPDRIYTTWWQHPSENSVVGQVLQIEAVMLPFTAARQLTGRDQGSTHCIDVRTAELMSVTPEYERVLLETNPNLHEFPPALLELLEKEMERDRDDEQHDPE